ncbi:MAG: ChbG/HpnK family deacetylase, partial [Candidatus Hydrogenedentes bacterium]|nr:ChbG/HpnK family deacetylase [Candidatus Hydrogenedentota bacterium]
PITHLDSHMGTLFASEDFFLRYLMVGIEKQIPILVAGGHLTFVREQNAEAAERLLAANIPETVWAAGLPVIDDIHAGVYDWKEGAEKKANLIRCLRELKPGITEFIFHCTRPGDEFAAISSSGPTRLADLNVMTDPEIKAVLKEEGIVLTTWRELKRRRDAVK